MTEAGKPDAPPDFSHPRELASDEYMSTLIHDLRNPLAPILNAAGLLRSLCTDPRHLQAVEIIERQVVALTRMLDELQDSGSEHPHYEFTLSRQTVHLAAIVEPAVRAARTAVDAQRQTLLVSIPTEIVRVNCDLLRLSQVLQTLLDNATRHTPRGGTIVVRAMIDGGELTIEISDNGVGIAPERLPMLFEIFTDAAPNELKRFSDDFNLATARRIVEMHGGTISATSEGVGSGSRFIIRLPMQTNSAAHVPEVQVQRNTRRVLIIDDHSDSAQSIAQVLARAGHSVLTAASGELGLALAEKFSPEAVIVDIGLPGLDGFEVARRLRDLPATQHALLLAVSGFSLKQFRDLESYSVFRHYLLKPTSPYTLMYIIEHTLGEA